MRHSTFTPKYERIICHAKRNANRYLFSQLHEESLKLSRKQDHSCSIVAKLSPSGVFCDWLLYYPDLTDSHPKDDSLVVRAPFPRLPSQPGIKRQAIGALLKLVPASRSDMCYAVCDDVNMSPASMLVWSDAGYYARFPDQQIVSQGLDHEAVSAPRGALRERSFHTPRLKAVFAISTISLKTIPPQKVRWLSRVSMDKTNGCGE